MKGRPHHLQQAWRRVRIPVTIVMVLYLVLICIRAGYHSTCAHDIRTISPQQGKFDAVVEEECCSGFGGWCEVAIKLRWRAGWGLDTKIFVYDPDLGPGGTHDPVVTWLSANELEIDVDSVSHIHSQLGQARGVKITYRIGSVKHP